ncbi:MAG: hypothetical protein MJ126_09125 [Lachnospiraceae bacterium]|nr:hypothetical protein [Lachnospiraceae bacterium]
MKTLKRNKVKIYYANYSNQVELKDSNGLYTGEYGIGYTDPVEVFVNVSAARGEAKNEMFGTDLNYSKKIVSETDLGWNENTVLWIDRDTTETHNYVVVSVAKSINSVTYAIKEVSVS